VSKGLLNDLSLDDWDRPVTRGDLALFEHRLEMRRHDRIFTTLMVVMGIVAIAAWTVVIAVGN
jgi:hypothetical protein